MFATLLGGLPRPPLPGDAPRDALLDACLALQSEHGIEPLTDGGWPLDPEDVVGSWRSTASRAGGLVKGAVVGPWSSRRDVEDVRSDILRLADAGCRWIEVHEPAAVELAARSDADAGDDRASFADQHVRLTKDVGPDVHLSLAITGGNADAAGIGTILAGSYASLAMDLIAGPDNWRLAVAAPTGVGIICGAVATTAGSDDGPEILVWAANYAAATGNRGMDRVGLATAGSLSALSWDEAATKVRRLGQAAALAAAPREEGLAAIDPRAIDIRSAALGRWEPRSPRRLGTTGRGRRDRT